MTQLCSPPCCLHSKMHSERADWTGQVQSSENGEQSQAEPGKDGLLKQLPFCARISLVRASHMTKPDVSGSESTVPLSEQT